MTNKEQSIQQYYQQHKDKLDPIFEDQQIDTQETLQLQEALHQLYNEILEDNAINGDQTKASEYMDEFIVTLLDKHELQNNQEIKDTIATITSQLTDLRNTDMGNIEHPTQEDANNLHEESHQLNKEKEDAIEETLSLNKNNLHSLQADTSKQVEEYAGKFDYYIGQIQDLEKEFKDLGAFNGRGGDVRKATRRHRQERRVFEKHLKEMQKEDVTPITLQRSLRLFEKTETFIDQVKRYAADVKSGNRSTAKDFIAPKIGDDERRLYYLNNSATPNKHKQYERPYDLRLVTESQARQQLQNLEKKSGNVNDFKDAFHRLVDEKVLPFTNEKITNAKGQKFTAGLLHSLPTLANTAVVIGIGYNIFKAIFKGESTKTFRQRMGNIALLGGVYYGFNYIDPKKRGIYKDIIKDPELINPDNTINYTQTSTTILNNHNDQAEEIKTLHGPLLVGGALGQISFQEAQVGEVFNIDESSQTIEGINISNLRDIYQSKAMKKEKREDVLKALKELEKVQKKNPDLIQEILKEQGVTYESLSDPNLAEHSVGGKIVESLSKHLTATEALSKIDDPDPVNTTEKFSTIEEQLKNNTTQLEYFKNNQKELATSINSLYFDHIASHPIDFIYDASSDSFILTSYGQKTHLSIDPQHRHIILPPNMKHNTTNIQETIKLANLINFLTNPNHNFVGQGRDMNPFNISFIKGDLEFSKTLGRDVNVFEGNRSDHFPSLSNKGHREGFVDKLSKMEDGNGELLFVKPNTN